VLKKKLTFSFIMTSLRRSLPVLNKIRFKFCLKRYTTEQSSTSLIKKEKQFVAHNYESLPVVLSRGKKATVWDVEGKKYLDFIAGYSALNQGHCHPRYIQSLF
jgi:4-aminobutyrate aminotransferase-like enzyme